MGSGVDVSVLTPVLNEEEHIREAVEAMRSQRFEGSVEFIFVDGRSEDRSAEILRDLAREDPRIRLLDNPTRRTPQALNIGLREARGEFVARMDAHTYYPPDYLQLGVDRLRRGGAEHVSGPQLAHGSGRWSRRVALALSTRLGTGGADVPPARRRARSRSTAASPASGGAPPWPSRVAGTRAGGTTRTPSWRHGSARRAAGSSCLPEMEARYVPRDSLAALARQYWRYGFYRAKTFGRHPETMRRSHVLAPGLALALLGALGRPPGRAGCARRLRAGRARRQRRRRATTRRIRATRPPCRSSSPACTCPRGFGFLAGCLRWGPPLKAFGRLVR